MQVCRVVNLGAPHLRIERVLPAIIIQASNSFHRGAALGRYGYRLYSSV